MSALEPQQRPPATKGHVSVASLADHWHIACRSDELRKRPLARTVLGTPLAVFRGADGQPAALLDRCPHRNVPLSLGRAEDGALRCSYHGWKFDAAGECREVPGLLEEPSAKARRALAFPTLEQDGYVWVHGNPEAQPERRPYRFPHLGLPGYTSVRGELEVEATLHATLENILDVPHTAFLHTGLFRSSAQRNEIEAVVRRSPDGVEAEYVGEPRPPGIAARILSPSGGVVQHWDRFLLPAVAQVEYRLGSENHILITQSLTPVEDFRTIIYSVISFRLRLPGWLVRPFLTPIAWRILRQDAEVLRRQSELIRRFGGEQFVSTEIDLLGPHIWRLLKDAERGEPQAEAPVQERRIRMSV
jgi:phenylpropionate dioxygenase-like ring-hydroxylating dioxygenase large terminal subunit